MLLFALCFQDEHATQVQFTVINLSHNMQLNIFGLSLNCVFF